MKSEGTLGESGQEREKMRASRTSKKAAGMIINWWLWEGEVRL